MPLSAFSRRRPPAGGRDLTSPERRDIPARFEAVADALAARRDPRQACAVAGATLAADGASLGEALSALAATYAALGLGHPSFVVAEVLGVAWSEETLAFVGGVSCEDPLTGLASSAHLRARLAEVYREADRFGSTPRTTHGLLVVDLGRDSSPSLSDPFRHALSLAGAADAVRGAFPGGETLARVGHAKVVALVQRDAQLGATAVGLRQMLSAAPGAAGVRIWIEGLPDEPGVAGRVLSGLSTL